MVDLILRKELEIQKNKRGLVGTRLEVNSIPGNSLSGHITTDWKNIVINYGQDLDLVPDKQTKKFIEQKQIINPELKVGQDIVEHEVGHRENPVGTMRGCPYTVEMHDLIKESIYKGLSEKGKPKLESYVTNAFEDVLDNVNCRVNTDFSGQTLFWNNQGLTKSQDKKYDEFYEAFVKINLFLGGNIQDHSLLKRFYNNSKEVKRAVTNVIDDFKESLDLEQVVRLHNKKEGFQKLFTTNIKEREQLWTSLAYNFALQTADLLNEDDMPKEQMFGGGEQGASNEDKGSSNPFDKAMNDPKNKQEIAYSRYKEGKGPAIHRDKQEQLYDLYKKISKEVVVKTSTYSEAMSMPLVHYGRRFVSEDETKIKFKGIGINQEGKINIKTTRHHLDHPVSYKTHPRQFPKFKLALMDRSGSMKYNSENEHDSSYEPKNVGSTTFIPWGDNSKYHFALKGYFGIENYLERQGISPYVECGVLGFSDEAAVKGDAKKVAKSLLYTPSGGTSLDLNGLEEQLDQESLVLSISDGEMSLSSEDKKRFEKKLSEQKTDFAHIQIGGQTIFSDYLQSINIPVFFVNGDNDLSSTMIDFVAGYYKNIKSGGEQK